MRQAVLLSLLGSEEPENRKFAVDWILKIRGEEEHGDLRVRDRITPKLNLQATSLQTLIPWKLEELHEPVYTCKLDRKQLSMILEKPFPVPKYSIHTQVDETLQVVSTVLTGLFPRLRRGVLSR